MIFSQTMIATIGNDKAAFSPTAHDMSMVRLHFLLNDGVFDCNTGLELEANGCDTSRLHVWILCLRFHHWHHWHLLCYCHGQRFKRNSFENAAAAIANPYKRICFGAVRTGGEIGAKRRRRSRGVSV
jgi:hypothetical protein